MKMNKKNLTAEQKKAARAAYAKAYYEKMKAKKADNKNAAANPGAKKNVKKTIALDDKTANAKKTAKKVEVKKAIVKKAAKKVEVKKAIVKKAAKKVEVKKATVKKTTDKFSMKPAQKLLDQIKKPLGNVRKLTKAYGKLITETLNSKNADSANRIVKLFSYSGFEFDPVKGVVTVSINGKVKVPSKKNEVKQVDAVKTAKKRGRKPKAENAIDMHADGVEEVKGIEEHDEVPETNELPTEAIDEIIKAEVNPDDSIEDDEEEIEDTSRDRYLDEGTRDYGETFAETEEAMRENGDWDN